MADKTNVSQPMNFANRAAANGMRLTLYITVLVLCTGASAYYSVASLIVWGASLGLPFYLCRMLLASARDAAVPRSFSELWAEGIASFFLGSLIPAIVAYVALKYCVPTFVAEVFNQSVEVFRALGSAEADALADSFEQLLASSHLPTAADVAAQIISFNIVCGTILSLFAALYARIRAVSSPRTDATAK